jgi:5-methylcytosine-specific restriction endonuclease McrA
LYLCRSPGPAVRKVTELTTLTANALSENVLVLNRYYAAIRVTSVRRAFSLLYRGLAEVVSVEDDKYISHDFASWREVSRFRARHERERHEWVPCVRFEMAVPRIVRLLFYDRLPQQTVKFNRRNIFARDANRCQYCGKRFSTSELSLDHVVPRSLGGKTTWENIVCCCVACNVQKGGRTPDRAGLKLIVKPVKPRRSPVIRMQLTSEKYASWRQFLDAAYWNVELKE